MYIKTIYKFVPLLVTLFWFVVEGTNNKTLKWGIAGAGRISHDFAVSVNTAKEGHEIMAVATHNSLERAKQFAQNHKISKAYGTYLELAKDPNVDVVYIGNVHPMHVPTSKLMMDHGKHVLCEKPLTLSTAATRDLINYAKNKSRFLMEAHWDLFQPATVFAMEQLRKGAIGEVRHVTNEFGVIQNDKERIIRKYLGGGGVLDFGVYSLNNIQMAFGLGTKALGIMAVGHLNEEGVDIVADAALKFSNHRSATIALNVLVEYPNRSYISGTNGTMIFGPKIFHPDQITINGVIHNFPHEPSPVPLYHGPGHINLKYEAEEVRKCLAEGKLESSIMTHEHSILLAEQCDDILKQIGVNYDSVKALGFE